MLKGRQEMKNEELKMRKLKAEVRGRR